ncbi:DNA polymerase IV [Ectobacillus ponti]|uniref:DNA polymerase IV n=1 Tax=Ectobacillus ponti TaxID=2961894 RepID=A0AA41X7H1_9BACI|nr:DNA polymerase IV [Ectobacillus ponti]MCP8967725.1 DNA polymerase IV [Ectobacillus ponti]
MGRVILHVDCDAFYAGVEQAHHPELRGKPLAIVGNKRKGFVITASYEARAKGIHTLMFIEQARRLCPDLIIKTPDFPLYKQESRRIFSFLGSITPLIEVASIDECYMDVSDVYEAYGGVPALVRHIQQRVEEEIGTTLSIGIAPCKFLAKMASGFQKPRGITVLRRRDIQEKLWPLPILRTHGIGEKSAALLEAHGIHTIGGFAKADTGEVKRLLGNRGLSMQAYVNGHDNRPVDPSTADQVRTLSKYRTFLTDTDQEPFILDELLAICQDMSGRLQAKGVLTQNVHLTIRYADRERTTLTRSRKLGQPIMEGEELFQAAVRLWRHNWAGDIIRLIGITVSDIVEKERAYKQLDLFSYQKDKI